MKPLHIRRFILFGIAALLATAAACAQPTAAPTQRAVTRQVEKSTAVVEKTTVSKMAATATPKTQAVTFTVAVPEYMAADKRLHDALARAGAQLEAERKLPAGSLRSQVIQIKGPIGICRAKGPMDLVGYPAPSGNPTTLGEVDLFLAPSNIVAIFNAWYGDKIRLADPPPDLKLETTPKLRAGFTDPTGRLLAVPQGSMPVMLIYNPALLKQYGIATDRLANVSWSEMIAIADTLEKQLPADARSAVVIADSSVALAAIESQTRGLFKRNFSIYDFLKGGFLELAARSDGTVDRFFRYQKVVSSQTYGSEAELQKAFAAGKIAFVLGTSGFLPGLRGQGYKDVVGIGYLPSYGDPKTDRGTSTMMLGWMVPARANSDLAWRLAAILSQEPGMLELGLAGGFLPVTSEAWGQLLKMERWSELLPVDGAGVWTLAGLVSESTAWQIPREFANPTYEPVLNAILNLAVETTASMADKDSGVQDARGQLQKLFADPKNRLP